MTALKLKNITISKLQEVSVQEAEKKSFKETLKMLMTFVKVGGGFTS